MKLDGFDCNKPCNTQLYRGGYEDDMVGYLPYAHPRRLHDTPLHSLLPFAHIDHVHPDAFAASSTGSATAAWRRVGWLETAGI